MKIGVAVLLPLCLKVCWGGECSIHQYRDDNGSCTECERCGPGFQPSQHRCGYGIKDPLFRCLPCLDGRYSLFTDHNLCITCKPCSKMNSVTISSCTSTSDSECGQCFDGYYRLRRSDGSTDEECFKCNADSDFPECFREGVIWKVVALIMTSLVIVLVLLILVCCCFYFKAKRSTSDRKARQSSKAQEDSLFSKVACDSEDFTTGSQEPLTGEELCERLPSSPTQPVVPSPNPPTTYSLLPTSQFFDSAAYHNLPTNLFTGAERRGNPRSGTFRQGSHPSVLSFQGSATNNRLDDGFRIDVDSFDTSSTQRSIVGEKMLG